MSAVFNVQWGNKDRRCLSFCRWVTTLYSISTGNFVWLMINELQPQQPIIISSLHNVVTPVLQFSTRVLFSFRLLYVSGLVRRPSVTVTIATASVLFIWSNDVTRCDVTISLCKAKLYSVHYYSPGERPATFCRTLNQSRARSKPLREGDYTLIGDVRL